MTLLCHNTTWKWSTECQEAFDTLKEKLASSEVLEDCDASAHGVGAVLLHVFPNGEERQVAYALCTLTQIEKEALSLVYGSYHLYLYRRKFLLVTVHKPLLNHFGTKETLAAARLQRWAVLLSAYQCNVGFRSTITL